MTTNIFQTNKYKKWYDQIIANARSNPRCGYVEIHHIIPRSMGGGNEPENLVPLSAREHYIVHSLLPRFVTSTQHKAKMWCAFRRIHFSNGNTFSSRLYEIVKPHIVKAHADWLRNKPQRKRTDDEKAQQSLRVKDRLANLTQEDIEKQLVANQKISAALTGRTRSKETCEKISIARTGVFNAPKDIDAWRQNKINSIPQQLANTDQVSKGKNVSNGKLAKKKKYSDAEKVNVMRTKIYRNCAKVYTAHSEINENTILLSRSENILTKYNQLSMNLITKYIGSIPSRTEVSSFLHQKGQ